MAGKTLPGETLTGDKSKRQHKATYATDKRKGGFLIRVAGPYADKFAGREVPVTTIKNEEHMEKLVRLIWTGKDTGEYGGVAGQPIALYTFEAKPREDVEEAEFQVIRWCVDASACTNRQADMAFATLKECPTMVARIASTNIDKG